MKKVFLVVMALVFMNLFTYNVEAKQTVSESEAQIVQTFCQGSELYAYVNIPKEKENKNLISSALLDHTDTYKQAEPILKVEESSIPISYLFLVDISTSMPGYADNIEKFVSEFMSVAGDNATFAIATFGSDFAITCDFTEKQEEVSTKLEEIEYNVKQTSLYSSIIDAIDYYETLNRQDGEIFNIVVLSDGIEYDKDGVTIKEVDEKIKSSSVMIHTFGLPTKSSDESDMEDSEEALKVLGSFARESLGVYGVLGYHKATEEDIAMEIISFVNQLYLTRFQLTNFEAKNKSYHLRIVFATTGENGDLFEAEGIVHIPYPEGTSKPEVTLAPDTGGIQIIKETEITENITKKLSLFELLQSDNLLGIPIWILVASVFLILLVIIIIFVLLKSKQKAKVESVIDTGIFMKLEILSDNCTVTKQEYYLSEELIIGRDKDCSIRLMNKDVSKKNSRLYVKDNAIYIEDLKSTNGTAINDMKIFSPNKLRSGDIISIGSVYFVIKF